MIRTEKEAQNRDDWRNIGKKVKKEEQNIMNYSPVIKEEYNENTHVQDLHEVAPAVYINLISDDS